MTVLDWIFFGNTVRSWAIALGIAAGTFALLTLVRMVLVGQLSRLSRRTENSWDDLLLRAVQVVRLWVLAVLALWAGANALLLPQAVTELIETIAIVTILWQLGRSGTTAIRTYVHAYGERMLDEDAASVMTVRALGFLGSVALWTIIFVVFLENLGIDVTALVATLGIGGIAVALAAQNILGDLFASLSIVLDKPFVVGDFIVVGDMSGTVERVGLKTTRVRSLSGEQLVFANSDLLASRIRNFKRMYERRIAFAFGVEYGTPPELLEWIPGVVREIIESLPDLRFDRAHFKTYGASSLDYEVAYFVLQPEYNVYMDRQQAINLELYRRLEERGIAFAFPTRTVHIVSGTGGPERLAPST